MDLKIATWNILADCYSVEYQNSWEIRQHKIKQYIQELVKNCDILLLQEIDHFDDFYNDLMISFNFKCEYIQRPHKLDGCLICYNNNKFNMIAVERIQFDDLAQSADLSDFIRPSFIRHNVGIMMHLNVNIDNNNYYFTIAAAHLYWNPNFPEVKSAQSKYLLSRIYAFAKTNQNIHSSNACPIILGGDFNILPNSEQYDILISPFQSLHTLTQIKSSSSSSSLTYNNNINTNIIYSNILFEHCYYGGEKTKFICDVDCSKLCRWLRVLGIDVVMHEIPKNTQHITYNNKLERKLYKANNKHHTTDYSLIFHRAKTEKRVILTTSKNMRQRALCPESVLVSARNLEESLIEIFHRYKLPLKRESFLTVCGKCGGEIVSISTEEYKLMFLSSKSNHESIESNNVNTNSDSSNNSNYVNSDGNVKWVPSDREIFMCQRCLQVYSSILCMYKYMIICIIYYLLVCS